MSGQLVITDTFLCPWERPYIFSQFNPLNTDRARYGGQQPALLEDFLMRLSFVVRTGFVLKPVRKLRDTAARKLNRGRKRKYSPLISRVF